MKINSDYVSSGILVLLVISIICGILITHISLVNNAPLSNNSSINSPESKGPAAITFPSDFTLFVQSPPTISSMPSYHKNTKNRSETDVRDLAAKFGVVGELSSEPVPDSKGEITYDISQLPAHFSANNKDFMTWNLEDEKDQDPKLVPTDSDAGMIADVFIASHGTYPGNVRVSIGHTQAESCDTTITPEPCKVVSERTDVFYYHIVDGYVFLPDWMSVEMGEHGHIIGFVSRWNSYEKTDNVKIIPPSEAVKILQKSGVQFDQRDVVMGKVTINSFKIVYGYADPMVWTDRVVPLYHFKGEFKGTNGTSSWEQYILALKET
jgi:hypothetical protein